MPHHRGGFVRGGGGMPPRGFMPPGPRMGGGYNGMPRGGGMRGGRGGRGGGYNGPKREDSNGAPAAIEAAQNGEETEEAGATVENGGDTQKNGDVSETKTAETNGSAAEEPAAAAVVPQQPAEVKEVEEESSAVAVEKKENGADGGDRTPTSVRKPDFESSASANSATSAW